MNIIENNFDVSIGDQKIDKPLGTVSIGIADDPDRTGFNIFDHKGESEVNFTIEPSKNQEEINQMMAFFKEETDKVMGEFMKHVEQIVTNIITKHIGITLEEAKKHDIATIYSDRKLEFYGIMFDGFFYDVEGKKYSIEWPFVEDVIREWDKAYEKSKIKKL